MSCIPDTDIAVMHPEIDRFFSDLPSMMIASKPAAFQFGAPEFLTAFDWQYTPSMEDFAPMQLRAVRG